MTVSSVSGASAMASYYQLTLQRQQQAQQTQAPPHHHHGGVKGVEQTQTDTTSDSGSTDTSSTTPMSISAADLTSGPSKAGGTSTILDLLA